MTKYYGALLGVLFAILLSACKSSQLPTDLLHQRFESDLQSFREDTEDFYQYIKTQPHRDSLKREFLTLRLQYKKIEAFAEYFTPTTVRLINGAPLDEIEDEENAVFEPGGLQVIEELLYADEPLEFSTLTREVRKMQVSQKRIQQLWEDMRLTDSQILDALRLNMFRLISLGISGFDTPASGNALGETEVVLQSFKDYLDAYRNEFSQSTELFDLVERALVHVSNQSDFNRFDRAQFIVDYINPVSRSLHLNQKQAGIPFVKGGMLLRGDAATMFDLGAFDPENIITDPDLRSTTDRIKLGAALFFDGRLSGDGNTSCASCHQPALAFTDGLKTSKAVGSGFINRNAPTLLYAAYQRGLFYDLRSTSLEDQAANVIHNKEEMHGSLEAIRQLIQSDKDYLGLYKKAYPGNDSVRTMEVQNALAVYVRSLGSFQSPFDAYMRGDKKALTDDQVNGFNIFMGKGRCGTCHFVPLFNGTVPPDFQRTESEVLGVTVTASWNSPTLDPDEGRGAYNHFPQWKNAFKTSTIRNIEKTAPYMHNGAYDNLQQLMEFYNEGGGAGLGLNLTHQTLASDKLNLTQNEMEQVISFMKSLSDPM
ncbi:cytochrome-c peroxidase [Dyadobacter tibetensis]|uniref:cytochrome-c peroxidase n=1 Tax=Dyadobacter tibetensis TaxID=1211851 RepID=UPI00046FA7FC|nr:cytochrome c peroxidase [Dyadobacter tibetensis]